MDKRGNITKREIKAHQKYIDRLVEKSIKKSEKEFSRALDRDRRYNKNHGK